VPSHADRDRLPSWQRRPGRGDWQSRQSARNHRRAGSASVRSFPTSANWARPESKLFERAPLVAVPSRNDPRAAGNPVRALAVNQVSDDVEQRLQVSPPSFCRDPPVQEGRATSASSVEGVRDRNSDGFLRITNGPVVCGPFMCGHIPTCQPMPMKDSHSSSSSAGWAPPGLFVAACENRKLRRPRPPTPRHGWPSSPEFAELDA